MILQEALTEFEVDREKLPPLEITQAEFKALLEYSCSIPTGVTEGKRWKQNIHFRRWIYQGLDPFGTPMIKYLDPHPAWIIRQYEYHSDTQCIIRSYRPVIVAARKSA